MNEPNAKLKQRSCYTYGFQAETAETICPQCKRSLQTSQSIRIRGFLMVLCGGLLIAMIGYISLWMLDAVNNGSPGKA